MKGYVIMKQAGIAATTLLGLVLAACQGNTQSNVELKTQQDSVSYCIGLDIGRNLKAQAIDVNVEALAKGIRDKSSDAQPLLTDEEAKACLTAFSQRLAAKQEEEMKTAGDENLKKSEEFLAENKKKDGVVTLPSGLQYKVITMGTGAKPKATETVSVQYSGKLIDGTEFDSSYKRGQPATFPVNGVIKGWTEALQLMPIGSKWELYIPPDLAYGSQGAGKTIGPNQALIFEVELLDIK